MVCVHHRQPALRNNVCLHAGADLEPLCHVVEWSIIFSIIINFALLPSSKLAKMMTGILIGVGCMLCFYLIAYYRHDVGRGNLFYAGIFSWSMFGAQFGALGGMIAIGIDSLVGLVERRLQPA